MYVISGVTCFTGKLGCLGEHNSISIPFMPENLQYILFFLMKKKTTTCEICLFSPDIPLNMIKR